MTLIRLNKYLASLGVASRRKIDEYTSQGRITINQRQAVLGDKVDPETDTLVVDKKTIPPHPPQLVYYAVNKPKFVLSTTSDDRGRDVVVNLVPPTPRVFPVGRLDYQSTGLMILTNDGDLALKLTHPRYHLPKVYLITILGKVSTQKQIEMQKTGAKVNPVSYEMNQTKLKITLYTGKKRQIRLLCAELHLYLIDLHRLSIGPLELGSLAPGDYRPLTQTEINHLKNP